MVSIGLTEGIGNILSKDVAEMINHSDISKMMRMVDDDEKVKIFCTLPSGIRTKFLVLVNQ